MTDSHRHQKAAPALFRPGARVDSYWVLRLIGRGGMGEVYLARDMKLGRRVALKVIHPDHLGSAKAMEDFLREARATARFNHPHIVTIYGVGEHHGVPYVALEYLNGQTLGRRMREDPPSVMESMRIGLAIAEALQEAHRNEVLHRDLKPENVFLSLDGRLRVIDFGLAELLTSQGISQPFVDKPPLAEDPPVGCGRTQADYPDAGAQRASGRARGGRAAPEDEQTTLAYAARRAEGPARPVDESTVESSSRPVGPHWQNVRGTPSYLSPEQWLGRPATQASDIWSLGVILYELVNLRRPYANVVIEALGVAVSEPDPVPRLACESSIPTGLAELVYACLEKDPRKRPAAGEAVEALRAMTSVVAPAHAEEESPFRGLLPFAEEHAGVFFGREAEVSAFVERLRSEAVLPVVGPSGAGKSSLVQAGVIPRLRLQGKWVVLRLRPGGRPFEALAASLRRGQRGVDEQRWLAGELERTPESLAVLLHKIAEQELARVLLVVDQLEELYTLCADDELRHRFMRAVCGGADDPFGPVRVIFTVRDDYLGRVAATPTARQALSHIVVVRSPDAEGLRQAVERPVTQLGYRFEDEQLVDRMIEAVKGEAACLPLLEFACTQLWEGRDRARLIIPRGVYEEIGGVEGALARHADSVLDGLSPLEERLARAMLLRLVTPERTRRAVTRPALLEDLSGDAPEVLDRLTSGRVVMIHRGGAEEGEQSVLELAHESLIRSWRRLWTWIEESQEERSFLGELEQAAVLWEKRGRRPEEVWQGDALREALRKSQRFTGQVPQRTRAFLDRGVRLERLRSRRRRLLVAGAFAVVVLSATVLAVQNREAGRQRNRAELQRSETQREGARAALMRGDLLEARAKLRGALETEDSPLGRVLWRQLGRDPLQWQWQVGAYLYAIAGSHDGERLAVCSHNRTVFVLDRYSRVRRELRGHDGPVVSAAFSPSGRALAAATVPGTIFLWDLSSETPGRLVGHQGMAGPLVFSPDGKLLATGGSDRTIRLWEVPSGRSVRVLTGHKARLNSVAFSADGKLLVSAAADRTIRFWEVSRGSEVRVLSLPPTKRPFSRIAVHPAGGHFAASFDETIRIGDLRSGAWQQEFSPDAGIITALQYSPAGDLLAVGAVDRRVLLLDARTGALTRELAGHRSQIHGIAFLQGGRLLASLGREHAVRLWDVGGEARNGPDRGHHAATYGLSFSPDGMRLASASYDGTLRVWDLATGRQRQVLGGSSDLLDDVSYSPDGKTLVSAGQDKMVRVWDAQTGAALAALSGHTDAVRTVRFTDDGHHLASGSWDGTVRLWEAGSWTLERVLKGPDFIASIALRPGGGELASMGRDDAVRIFDLGSGLEKRALRGPSQPGESLVYHPSGHLLFSSSKDQTIWEWDLASGSARVIRRFDSQIFWMDVSHDGSRIGVPLADGTAHLWERTTGRSLVLRGHVNEVNAVRFDRQGTLVATSSDDGSVRVWEAATGRPWWRGPVMLHDPPRLLTQRGWVGLDAGELDKAAARHAWARAAADRARLGSISPDGRYLCFQTQEEVLELWDRAADRRLLEQPLPGLRQVLAVPGGCASLADGRAVLHQASGGPIALTDAAQLVTWDRDQMLVASRGSVFFYDERGRLKGSTKTGAGVTAAARVHGWLVLGFENGSIELRPLSAGSERPSFSFESASPNPVLRLAEGPMRTLIAAFADGLVGLWSVENGTRLDHARIHGPVVHLRLDRGKLYAASELGDHLVLDLGVFYEDYCSLLRDVWSRVPMVWENGLPAVRPPPARHRCLAGR